MKPQQIQYLNTPDRTAAAGYVRSLWSDGKVRLTNLKTGRTARTFRNQGEAANYLRSVGWGPSRRLYPGGFISDWLAVVGAPRVMLLAAVTVDPHTQKNENTLPPPPR